MSCIWLGLEVRLKALYLLSQPRQRNLKPTRQAEAQVSLRSEPYGAYFRGSLLRKIPRLNWLENMPTTTHASKLAMLRPPHAIAVAPVLKTYPQRTVSQKGEILKLMGLISRHVYCEYVDSLGFVLESPNDGCGLGCLSNMAASIWDLGSEKDLDFEKFNT